MTPPSIQNLKALGLRIFFLIGCSTFSFLPNVRLRLTLEYLTKSIPYAPTISFGKLQANIYNLYQHFKGEILKFWFVKAIPIHIYD